MRALGSPGFIAEGEGKVLRQSARKLTLRHDGDVAILRIAVGQCDFWEEFEGVLGELRVDEYGAASTRSAQRRVNVVNREGEKKRKKCNESKRYRSNAKVKVKKKTEVSVCVCFLRNAAT